MYMISYTRDGAVTTKCPLGKRSFRVNKTPFGRVKYYIIIRKGGKKNYNDASYYYNLPSPLLSFWGAYSTLQPLVETVPEGYSKRIPLTVIIRKYTYMYVYICKRITTNLHECYFIRGRCVQDNPIG